MNFDGDSNSTNFIDQSWFIQDKLVLYSSPTFQNPNVSLTPSVCVSSNYVPKHADYDDHSTPAMKFKRNVDPNEVSFQLRIKKTPHLLISPTFKVLVIILFLIPLEIFLLQSALIDKHGQYYVCL